jgi:deoxyribodipyrimidine photo-lyase
VSAAAQGRDRPDLRARRGCRRICTSARSRPRILSTLGSATEALAAGDVYARELGWREFGHHVLYHWPRSPDQNFNPRFDEFEWLEVPERALDTWRRGLTGVPIVDAGMRDCGRAAGCTIACA